MRKVAIVPMFRNHDGREIFVPKQSVASFIEAGTSSQWHGIYTILYTTDRRTIELSDRIEDVRRQFEESKE